MGVTISPNMKRTREMIDINSNVIDPETKAVLKKNEPDYIPTKEEIEAQINGTPTQQIEVILPAVEFGGRATPQSIQERLDAAKQIVVELELEKKAEIQRMKDELARLEAE